jgi:hypothetical protein
MPAAPPAADPFSPAEPRRAPAEHLAAALVLALADRAPLHLLSARPGPVAGVATILANGWRLALMVEQGRPTSCLFATGPGGESWEHGCQRNDWTLGPDSVLIDPLQLLTADEQLRLADRLRTLPQPPGLPYCPIYLGPAMDQVAEEQQAKRKRRKPAGRGHASADRQEQPT